MIRNRSGFTLIELIIVIVIIGILASIAAPMMSGMRAKAVYAEAAAGLAAIRTAVRQYYVEYEGYPPHPASTFINDIVGSGHADYFPGLTLTIGGTPAGGSSLDGRYFSQGSYQYYNDSGSPIAICGRSDPDVGVIQLQMHLDDGSMTIGYDSGEWRPYP